MSQTMEQMGSATVSPAGEAGIVGPALSCFDVDLSAAFQPGSASKSSSEAKRTAQQQATAQEARHMLGTVSQ